MTKSKINPIRVDFAAPTPKTFWSEHKIVAGNEKVLLCRDLFSKTSLPKEDECCLVGEHLQARLPLTSPQQLPTVMTNWRRFNRDTMVEPAFQVPHPFLCMEAMSDEHWLQLGREVADLHSEAASNVVSYDSLPGTEGYRTLRLWQFHSNAYVRRNLANVRARAAELLAIKDVLVFYQNEQEVSPQVMGEAVTKIKQGFVRALKLLQSDAKNLKRFMADLDAAGLTRSALPCDMLDIVAQPVTRYIPVSTRAELSMVHATYASMRGMADEALGEVSKCIESLQEMLNSHDVWPDPNNQTMA